MKKLIDKEYKRQLNHLHQEGLFNNGKASYGIVKRFIKRFAPKSILDFGCGHGALMGVIKYNHPNIIIDGYDPGNPKFLISSNKDINAFATYENGQPITVFNLGLLNRIGNAIQTSKNLSYLNEDNSLNSSIFVISFLSKKLWS